MPDSAPQSGGPLISAERLRVRTLLAEFVAVVDAEKLPIADVLEELAKVAGVGLGMGSGQQELPRPMFLEQMARWFERVADVAVRRYQKAYTPRPRPFHPTVPGGSFLN